MQSPWFRTMVVRRLTLQIADFYVGMLTEDYYDLLLNGQYMMDIVERFAGLDFGHIIHEDILRVHDPVFTCLHGRHLQLVSLHYQVKDLLRSYLLLNLNNKHQCL